MILYGSTMSPFVRVVRVVAREVGVIDRIEEAIADPWGDPGFRRINPLGKIPALVMDDGAVVYDSPVICELLDGLHDGVPLFPEAGPVRWRALTLRACAIGLMDAAYLRRNEAIRVDPATRSPAFIERQDASMRAALDALTAAVETLADPPDIAGLSVGTALGYLDFRYPGCGWRTRHPELAAWWAETSRRPSFSSTEHSDPPGVSPREMATTLSFEARDAVRG